MLFQENSLGVLLSSTVVGSFAVAPSSDPITFSQLLIALLSKSIDYLDKSFIE